MKIKALACAAVAGLVLTGCGPSRARYEAGAEAMRGSPQLRQKFLVDCGARMTRMRTKDKEILAALMMVPDARISSVACQRMSSAIVRGKMTYEDVQMAAMGRTTPKMVRILQNRE